MSVNIPGDIKARLNDLDSPTLARMVFSTDRAWWWEEVGTGYKFRESEPWRVEFHDGTASEGKGPARSTGLPSVTTYFRDTRWTAPPPPLKVGDVIETVEDLERLPEGAGVTDYADDLVQKRDDGMWHYAAPGVEPRSGGRLLDYADPLTVVYLPEVNGSDD